MFPALAGSRRQALIAVVLAVATPATAAPRRGQAKLQFDRGVAAFSKGDFAAAAEALARSFALQADTETLFAWAQAERRLDHCKKALELYGKLLKLKLPSANRDAVHTQIAECKDALAAKSNEHQTTEPPPAPDPVPDPVPAPSPPGPSVTETPRPPRPPVQEEQPWWKDPVGDSLLVLGVGGLATGGVFLMSARAAEHDKATATSYGEYQALDAKATSNGQIGVGALAAGGVLVITSLAWYATHRGPDPSTAITLWHAPGADGFAVVGRF